MGLPPGYDLRFDINTRFETQDKALLYAPDGSLIGHWSLYMLTSLGVRVRARRRARLHRRYSVLRRKES